MEHDRRQVLEIYNCGVIPYLEAWNWQKSLQQERMEDPTLNDVLILVEHPAVYTLGEGATLDNIKFDLADPNYAVYRIERGGEVTYHCLGQIVGYPIFNLRHHQQDLHWYLRQLEEVIIQVLSHYELQGKRIPGLTGVWIDDRKIAAIGIKVSKWITLHGFALNVCPDLSGFNQIIPCGIRDKRVGSLREFVPEINPEDVRQLLIEAIVDIFGFGNSTRVLK
jgi:lipoyl(octanoyl) transferase